MVSLQDLPKKVQYIIVDSEFVNGTNNTFTIDLSLESNLHVEEISEVIGIKPVDFYITQVGENDLGNTNVAKYIDIVCDDVPKRGQILNERNGQILARVPLERSFTGSNDFIMRDKQWRSFQRQTNLFNTISIQKLIGKIDDLNINVKKLPDKEDIEKMKIEKKKKYPLRYIVLFQEPCTNS